MPLASSGDLRSPDPAPTAPGTGARRWRPWITLAGATVCVGLLVAGWLPIRGTLPDLGHRVAHLAIPDLPGFRIITNSIRLGPSDEVRAWLQHDTTLIYFAARCNAGTYRVEATPAGALKREWAPVAPGRRSEAFSTVLCGAAPQSFGQRLMTRVRWILPPLPSRMASEFGENPFTQPDPQQVLREADFHLRRLRIMVRLRSWLERGRDTVTEPGVDSAAFAARIISACDSLRVNLPMFMDTLPGAELQRCAQTQLRSLEAY